MAESIDSGGVTGSLRPTPELPRRLTDLTPVVMIGTGVWGVALVVMIVVHLSFPGAPTTWLWTCLAGFVLGFLGLGIVAWQRAASRRGAKGAQRGI